MIFGLHIPHQTPLKRIRNEPYMVSQFVRYDNLENERFEVRKAKLVLAAMASQMAWLAGLVALAVFGQNLATQTKLYVIFGSGQLVMLAMVFAMVRFFTREEIKHNYWVPVVVGGGVALGSVMLWMSYSSPPQL